MSNSNFNITKVVVDPVSQEISSLEVNGKPIETGGELNLQVGYLENLRPGDSGIFDPDEDYDGFSYVEYEVEQANLENVDYDKKTPLNVSSLFGDKPTPVKIEYQEGYDGISTVDIYPGGLTGLPEPNLQNKNLGFVASDDITITPDSGYDGLASVTFWTEAEIFSRTVNNVKYIGDAGLNFTLAQDLEHIWRYDSTSGDWKAVEFTKVIDSANELVTVTITDSGFEFDWNIE